MSSTDWVLVSLAVLGAGAVLGVLLTRPVWAAGGRPGLAPALLTAHTGTAAVVGVVLIAALVRSWQLLDDPAGQADGLLDISRTDGDGSMYALLVLAVALMTVLLVWALALAARFATGADPIERIVACAVLGLEISVAGYAAARVLGGSRSALAIGATAHLPLVVLAMVACWPPAEPAPAPAVQR